MKKEEKAILKAKFKNPYKVGDILHNSWGYDQTNCEFYQVVSTTKATVNLKPIKSQPVEDSEGFMCNSLIPIKDAFCEGFLGALQRYAGMRKEIRKKVSAYVQNNGELRYYIPTNHGSCTLWDGQPKYNSWYA